jgi:rRNA maturation endonuclease Nob1
MKFITNIIKKILSKEIPKPLGRWRIENCNSLMNKKIDLSNEDHCGLCGHRMKIIVVFVDNTH